MIVNLSFWVSYVCSFFVFMSQARFWPQRDLSFWPQLSPFITGCLVSRLVLQFSITGRCRIACILPVLVFGKDWQQRALIKCCEDICSAVNGTCNLGVAMTHFDISWYQERLTYCEDVTPRRKRSAQIFLSNSVQQKPDVRIHSKVSKSLLSARHD